MGLSRQTLLSLWLALVLGLATWVWCAEHPDDCARRLDGDSSLPATQEIDAGHGASVTVPCGVWLPRQRPAVQAAVAVDAILVVMAALSFWADTRRWSEQS